MSCCGFVDDLLIHIHIIKKVIFAIFSSDGLIHYVHRYGVFELDGGWFVAGKDGVDLGF